MAKQNAALQSFTHGETSKEALGRIDIEKMRLAAECQVNWMPYVLGPMQVRPGLQYIGEVYLDAAGREIPFVFSKLDTARIELTPSIMRVWVSDAVVTRVSVSTTITSGTMLSSSGWVTTGTTDGASATIANGEMALSCPPIGGLAQTQQTVTVGAGDIAKEHGLRIVVSNGPVTARVGTVAGLDDLVSQTDLDTGTHSLAFTPGQTSFILQMESHDPQNKIITSVSIDPAGALTLPTPWGASDMANISDEQSGDIIYIACDGIAPYKIERRSTNGWSVAKYLSNNGPMNVLPSREDTRVTPSACFGNITISSDKPIFEASNVGQLMRMFNPGQDFTVIVGANDTWTPAFRVDGLTSDRDFVVNVSGTWVGTVRLQRSVTGPDSGWVDIGGSGGNQTNNAPLKDTTGGSRFDNVAVWYRAGFKGGEYTSGAATFACTYKSGGRYGVVRITNYVSSTSVAAEVLTTLMTIKPTTNWSFGQWSSANGYPTSVKFHEGRLGWYGQDNMWLSASGGYTDFSEIKLIDGTDTGDGGPIIERFGYGPVDVVAWGLSLSRLLLGREGSIASVRSNTLDEPMTPTNISIKDCSTQGAARIKAIKIDKAGIFVQQSGRRVYELNFNSQQFDYIGHDLTRLNLDIGAVGFVDIAAQRQPDTYVHFVRTDGQDAVLLYDPEDEVEGWFRYQTLGIIENVCVLPASDIEDHVYFRIKRTINGTTKRYVEKLARRSDCIGGTLNNMADAYVSWTGTAASTMSGLSHLEGETVVVWADGEPIGNATVLSGAITFPDGDTHTNAVAGLGGVTYSTDGADITQVTGIATKYSGYPALLFADGHYSGTVAVGSDGTATLPNARFADKIVAVLGYSAVFESAKLAYAAQGGTALNQKKKIDHIGVTAYDTHYQGFQYGSDLSNLRDLPQVENERTTTTDKVWDQYDKAMIPFAGTWDTDSRLVLYATAPYPAKIGAAVVSVRTSDKL